MKAIVTGMIATYPLGGVVWDYAQYALGLEKLGFEVYYLEDAGMLTYDPRQREYVQEPSYGVEFLARSLSQLSPTLGRRWQVRTLDGRTFGMDQADFSIVLRDAQLFLNVSGGSLLRPEYLECPRKVLIDTDPGLNHFSNYARQDAGLNTREGQTFRGHDFFFTYAERIGQDDCMLPTLSIEWQPTRPPVVLDCWKSAGAGTAWTTVMSWKNFSTAIEYKGVRYGSKEIEFEKVKALPRHARARLEVASGGEPPIDEWREYGWSVLDAHQVSSDAGVYRDYIQASRGEFSVAKNVYVATRSGWFSGRSTCYLAAKRPVVVQDTGFSKIIPCGSGLLTFSNMDEASAAIESVEADYTRHGDAARSVAETYFAADVVLGKLLDDIGLGVP
jgi:hypothetical protein